MSNMGDREKESNLSKARGLYVPELESDACGIGMVVNLNAVPLNSLVKDALTILEQMEHRGACGFEENSGDGAGILTQIPQRFFKKEASNQGISLPEFGFYSVGFLFLPKDATIRNECLVILDKKSNELGFKILWSRDVPVNNSIIGETAKSTEPFMQQIFFDSVGTKNSDAIVLENRLYLLRNTITRAVVAKFPDLKEIFYFCSLSSETIVYKGQLTASQLRKYYPDLMDEDYESALALVHSRFSTNTVPKWKLAQPFRTIAHNGEINTIKSNVNWWNAREKSIVSSKYNSLELDQLLPVCSRTLSDSGNFDAVLEFLVRNGISIQQALLMMIPEAWKEDTLMPQYKKDFYEFQEYAMEPWDGPASMVFTDGHFVGATLDRNGLRPSKYCLTTDNVLILASESGVLQVPPEKIIYKGNLSPGQILIADLKQQKIIGDEALKLNLCKEKNYAFWLQKNRTYIDDLPDSKYNKQVFQDIALRKLACGFTSEDEQILLDAMIKDGKEATSSMGTDIPLAVLSTQSQHISNYFKQQFAQVTNPPIDPIRERPFMSLDGYLGKANHILAEEISDNHIIRIASPLLSETQFYKIAQIHTHNHKVCTLNATFYAEESNLSLSIERCLFEAFEAHLAGCDIIIIDNSKISPEQVSIPALLITGALHHFFIEKGVRRDVSLILKASDVLEVHHFATLCGYGADAIYPELTYQIIAEMCYKKQLDLKYALKNYEKAVNEGLYKVMSKLGISTMLSYKGAQAFEAVGIGEEVINLCFKSTISRIGGLNFKQLAREQIQKHFFAYANQSVRIDAGRFKWKKHGEYHLFNPQTVHLLQHSTQTGNYQVFKKYSELINNQSERACTLRSLFSFKPQKSIPIESVESIESILKRFATGAMSFGSISEEAHTTLAIAMNRIGGKSNSGEGGEDSSRYNMLPNGDSKRSAIKQVASGRFGVTIEYLNNADEIQIKMAQGAKPGEGGQLPGHKVDENIAKIRHATPGVGLISPPPHHDIYSIEDLAELIFDLKNANEKARISVKLVSKAGVGIIASGVAKAHADHILISGHDGGTGASPLSSIMHAGMPWEIGLSETHQTLVKNGLRDRVVLQTDGQIRTGKDMAIATLLGAEEWGIATAALVVSGCIIMRKCHLNTCPVGIATQDENLRQNYNGKVEHLINYFRFLAQEMREIMAEHGFKTVNEMVGATHILDFDLKNKHWKYENLDLSPILFKEKSPYNYQQQTKFQSVAQNHNLENVLDRKLIKLAHLAIKDRIQINSIFKIRSTDRAVGTMLSSAIVRKYGARGLDKDAIQFKFKGSAGQSFGAFGIHGIHFTLEGEANDYFGKGLSGATLVITPDNQSTFDSKANIIIGNVALFGATSGEVYIKGRAGERFAVRNSGASAVVEGVGDNACEYMTGGHIVILGGIGRNFAAGMSGGIAYIFGELSEVSYHIKNDDMLVEKPNEKNLEEIRSMIRNHFRFTGSPNALSILQSWEKQKHNFSKVISAEYNRIVNREKVNFKTEK